MNKKEYESPTMIVVMLQHQTTLLQSSSLTLTDVNSGDTDITLGGAGSGPARARQQSGIDWDDWD